MVSSRPIAHEQQGRIHANESQARSSPSPGTSPLHTSAPHTDRPSPVIVAENMIGVAMYELVRSSDAHAKSTC